MGLAAVEAAALASSTFAALAAGASWANVIQTRDSLKASVLPDLHVTAARVDHVGPIYGIGRGVTSLQFHVYNAGGGIAKGAGYVIWHGGEYVVGSVAPMVRPGQTYRIETDMTPAGGDAEWGGIVACSDLHNSRRRTWTLPGTRLTVTKGADGPIALTHLYRQVDASPDLSGLSLKRSKVELVTQ